MSLFSRIDQDCNRYGFQYEIKEGKTFFYKNYEWRIEVKKQEFNYFVKILRYYENDYYIVYDVMWLSHVNLDFILNKINYYESIKVDNANISRLCALYKFHFKQYASHMYIITSKSEWVFECYDYCIQIRHKNANYVQNKEYYHKQIKLTGEKNSVNYALHYIWLHDKEKQK